MAVDLPYAIHAPGELAAGGQVGEHHITAEREQRLVEAVAVARRAADVELVGSVWPHWAADIVTETSCGGILRLDEDRGSICHLKTIINHKGHRGHSGPFSPPRGSRVHEGKSKNPNSAGR